ncbi:inactive protein kinase SELMODRAFT_444075-like isoform X2 [Primulina tabacum]|uniref:inactive protein kinase SELMODRAFT_444075-like isoform X2 n=1 Tax=Primulina tabacum TaxID=48773 RepID=UPI003F59374B
MFLKDTNKVHLHGMRVKKVAVGAAQGSRYLHKESTWHLSMLKAVRSQNVYSFGVVLVELVTGRKAVDLNRPKGLQCLAVWAHPLLDAYATDELVDPWLGSCYIEHEVYCMLHAAYLCIPILVIPRARPRMFQVLGILEGHVMDPSCQLSTPGFDVGSRSGRFLSHHRLLHEQQTNSIDETSRCFGSKLSLYSGTSLTAVKMVR